MRSIGRAMGMAMVVAVLMAWRVGAQAPPTLDVAAIDAYVEAQMAADRVPGAALAIVHGDEVVYLKGYGTDGYGRPVTPQTSFLLGSMSKSFTAMAVMQLVEQGKVELDAPVQRYLPWFHTADAAASATITARHLLTHTSGIPTYAPHAPDREGLTVQDQVRALATVSLNHPVGSTHEYASPNYLVLAALIEEVSGQSYAEYVQSRIFTPLQMSSSFTDQQAAIAQGMAQGHRYWLGFPVAVTLPYESDRMATAALISSAESLSHYLIAQLNEGRYGDAAVLSLEGMAQMHQPAAPGAGFSYAFGWRVSEIGGVPAVHHGGVLPHFRGKMVMLPTQGWGVALLTNASTAMPLPLTPTSHFIADNVAASLVGQAPASRTLNQSVMYMVVAFGMAMVLGSQLSSFFKLRRWREAMAAKPPRAALLNAASEFLWPLAAWLVMPRVLRLPWAELMRGTPDMAWWVIATAVLALCLGIAKLIVLRPSLRSATAG